MKKSINVLVWIVLLFLAGCGEKAAVMENESEGEKVVSLTRDEIKAASFQDLFTQVEAKDIQQDIFSLFSVNNSVITAGKEGEANSMVAGWGGWGIIFGKPAVFNFLRANRYTLVKMREEQKYTISFFEEQYREDFIQFGMKSGADSDKMKETKLTSVQTPNGNPAYKEAKIILECNLVEVTTVNPEDFYTEDSKSFVVDAFNEVGEYHKMVFGEIAAVWVRK